MFSARYGLPELPNLCRITPPVLYLIQEKLLDPTCGLGYFLNDSVPLEALSELVKAITDETIVGYINSRGDCILPGCRNSVVSVMKDLFCDTCRKQYT